MGRLLLGEFQSWDDFWAASGRPLSSIPRRNLKGGVADVRKRVKKEIEDFCRKNFKEMSVEKLEQLFLDIEELIRGHGAASLPLVDFEHRYGIPYARLERRVPRHAFVHISLWGLNYWFPEDKISKDLIQSLRVFREADRKIHSLSAQKFSDLVQQRADVANAVGAREFSLRNCLLNSFALMEAYLNGLAWDHLIEADPDTLPPAHRKLLEDTGHVSLRKKLLNYPSIVSGSPCSLNESNEQVKYLLEFLKPFRDSLMHPSPMAAHANEWELSKLVRMQMLEGTPVALSAAACVAELIVTIERHINRDQNTLPMWLQDLGSAFSLKGHIAPGS